MRQLLDFLPLIVFFIVYRYFDVFTATQALIVTTALTLAFLWYQFRKAGKTGLKAFLKAEKVPVFTFIMLLLFGSLTIYFHQFSFLIWKVTIIYGLFAIVLLVSQFIFKKPLIQSLLGKEITLPQHIWSQLNLFWTAFFVVCAIANLYIGFTMPEATWITFKTFIFPGIMLVATVFTVIYIYRFLPKEGKSEPKSNEIDSTNNKE